MIKDIEYKRHYGRLEVSLNAFKQNETCMEKAFKRSGLGNDTCPEFDKFVEDNWEDIIEDMSSEKFLNEFYNGGAEEWLEDILEFEDRQQYLREVYYKN